MSASSARDMVAHKAKSDPDFAYEIAKGIDDPWFRSQALAWVARFGPEIRFDLTVKESLKAGLSAKEPYQTVAVHAWPIRAMIERGRSVQAQKITDQILPLAAPIENPVSRADALFLLFQAVFSAESLRRKVLAPLLTACEEMDSWKGPLILRDAARMLVENNREEAIQVLSAIPEGRAKRQAARSIVKGDSFPPREFFW